MFSPWIWLSHAVAMDSIQKYFMQKKNPYLQISFEIHPWLNETIDSQMMRFNSFLDSLREPPNRDKLKTKRKREEESNDKTCVLFHLRSKWNSGWCLIIILHFNSKNTWVLTNYTNLLLYWYVLSIWRTVFTFKCSECAAVNEWAREWTEKILATMFYFKFHTQNEEKKKHSQSRTNYRSIDAHTVNDRTVMYSL